MLKLAIRLIVAAVVLLAPATARAAGEKTLTALDSTYVEAFDTLAAAGTSSVTPPGWALTESGSNANTTYTAGTGSSTAGDTYSFGTSADRAFGGLQSGSLISTIGVGFLNQTGTTITSLDLDYSGEEWRLGTLARGADRLDFQYQVGATGLLAAGAWTDLDVLDFSTPNLSGTAVGLRDGNLAANRTNLVGTISGLSIAPGQTVWIRWIDFNASGSDDGLAVDDFRLTPRALVATDSAPSVTSTAPANGTTGIAANTNITINFSEPVTTAANWFTIACSSSGSHTASSSVGLTSFTLDPATDFTPGENCTVTILAARVTDNDSIDPPDTMAADYPFTFTIALPVDAAPAVVSTTPAGGATNVDPATNLTVTFSEPVTVVVPWFTIACTQSGGHSATFSGGPTTFTIDPAGNFADGESCTTTIDGTHVHDVDTNDPPDLAASFSWTVSTASLTAIHDVQGAGSSSPLVGQTVTVEGVVVGDYQAAGQFSGFFVQEQDSEVDANPATSEGIFVFGSTLTDVSPGDVVRVRGTVAEFNGLTELSPVTSVTRTATGAGVTPVSLALPVTDVADLEHYEGMRVDMPQTLTVTEVFGLGRFGEVGLSGAGRLYTPTAVATPGADANAVEAQNARSRIVLDDGYNQQNLDPVLYPQGGLSATNTLRVGDQATGVTGVLDFRRGATGFPFVYRIQPVALPTFIHTNPRTSAPEEAGGNLGVASFNVLNYFNGDGAGGGFPTSRGANTAAEFQRQRAKEISALKAMDADVVGLMEMENDSGPQSAVADLVSGLNDAMGAGTYAYVDTGVIGTDEIRVALIYKPATISTVGDWKILTAAVDPRFDTTKNRPSLAQTFRQTATGRKLTVVVNHLKSKGSACGGDPDTGDGSGNCNLTRTNAAAALVDWLATDPTGSGDPDFLLIGDMNSYTFESPIRTMVDGGLTNLVRKYGGLGAYSYVFDGESGYLDHALATPSLEAQVAGVGHWHINPDEPAVLDYNTEFKSAGQQTSLYSTAPYRASDHDPVVIGIELAPAPVANAGGPYTVAEGGSVPLSGTGTGDHLTYAWDLDGDGTYETAGATPVFSAAGLDGPTTREVALKVSDGELSDISKATVTITNVAPSASISGVPAGSPEGTQITAIASSTDPGPDAVGYAWNVTKDGAPYATGAGASFSYTPDDNGTYTVTLTATDDDGGAGTAQATTSVTNVAPTATFTASPSVYAGSPIALALTSPSDPSTIDTAAGFTYAFDCGSGTFVASATPTAACSTSDTGTRTVRGKITDKDGGSTVYSTTVQVVVTVASLCDLTTAYVSKEGVAHSLCVKLEHGSYGAYENEVAAQSGKSLTAAQAATLTRLVRRL